MTYDGGNRPHLGTEAIEAIERLVATGVYVHASEVALLCILADKVDASHGQWFGSLSRLAERLPWERHWFSKWLKRLEAHGLVENLGYVNRRALATWQLLPDLYPALDQVEPDASSHPVTGGTERFRPPGTDHNQRVASIVTPLVAATTTIEQPTPSERKEEHRRFTKPIRTTDPDNFDIDAERERQRKALLQRYA